MENDKTIFNILKPSDNEKLSMVSKSDIEYFIKCIDKYYLEYRDRINVDNHNTFGIEIEFENYSGWFGDGYRGFKDKIDSVIKNDKWDLVGDWSLRNGGEIVSEILTDNIENWNKIKRICNFISEYGENNVNCGSHVHAGAQILGDNTEYWNRLFKTWSVYENIIYRFSYGETYSHRPNIMKYARPAALFYMEGLNKINNLKNYNVLDLFWCLEAGVMSERFTKGYGLSYWRMLADDDYNIYTSFEQFIDGCTLEYRVPNGTFNEIIWQNNINFIIKLLLYCKSDRYDEDIINRRMLMVCNDFSDISTYKEIFMDQVLEFVDMIFDNNLDKIYFLKQYFKDINETDLSFRKTKKLTIIDRRERLK